MFPKPGLVNFKQSYLQPILQARMHSWTTELFVETRARSGNYFGKLFRVRMRSGEIKHTSCFSQTPTSVSLDWAAKYVRLSTNGALSMRGTAS